jgi:hypothetical protein
MQLHETLMHQFAPPFLHDAESALPRLDAFKATKGESRGRKRDQYRLK